MAFDKKVLIDTPIMIDLLRGIEKSKNWLDGIEIENRLKITQMNTDEKEKNLKSNNT